jgi:integrase
MKRSTKLRTRVQGPSQPGPAGPQPREWTPRELRHSFVSLLSDAGVPIEQISRLVGHSGTTTAETIYRKQIRPVLAGELTRWI